MFRSYTSDDKAAEGSGARRLGLLAIFSILGIVVAMIVAVGFFSVCDDTDATDASGVTVDGTQYDTITKALEGGKEGTIRLNSNISDSFEVSLGKIVTVDLNGKKLTLTSSVLVKGTLTIMDSSVEAGPVYRDGTVNYTSGEIVCCDGTVVGAVNGGEIIIDSGAVKSTDRHYGYAVCAIGNDTSKNATPVKSTIIMNGGFIEAQENSLVVFGVGAKLVVNGGLCHSRDNAVISGNGTGVEGDYNGGTYIEINGGTFIGDITTNNYVACGIYHPQAGTLVVNGGSFIINKGVGILMRGGTFTMDGGEITTSGNIEGKVGDSRVVVTCTPVFIDLDAGYYDCANMRVKISGGTFNSGVEALGGLGQYSSMYSVTGGKFCTSVSDFLATGYDEMQIDGYYTVFLHKETTDDSGTTTTEIVYPDGTKEVEVTDASGASQKTTTSERTVNDVEISVTTVVVKDSNGDVVSAESKAEFAADSDGNVSTAAVTATVDAMKSDDTPDLSKTISIESETEQIILEGDAVIAISSSGAVLEYRNTAGTLTADSDVVSALADQEYSLALYFFEVESDTLSKAQQKVVGDSTTYSLALIRSDGVAIHNLNGTVTVTVGYDPSEGESLSDIQVIYVDDDGNMEAMNTEYDSGILTFRTGHFSCFMIGTSSMLPSDPVIVPSYDDDDYYPVVPVTPASTSSDDDDTKTIVACAAAAVAVALAVAFFLVDSRRP